MSEIRIGGKPNGGWPEKQVPGRRLDFSVMREGTRAMNDNGHGGGGK